MNDSDRNGDSTPRDPTTFTRIAQGVAPSPPRRGSWIRTGKIGGKPAVFVVAGIVLAATTFAAITITYTNSSTQTVSLRTAPVIWAAGADSSGNSYIASWTLSANQTYFTVTLKPVPEANVTWGNLTTLQSQDTATITSVTITGTSVAAYTKILTWRLEFHDYGTGNTNQTLILTDASPSITFTSMPTTGKYYVKQYIKLDTNTGQGDLPSTVSLSISIVP